MDTSHTTSGTSRRFAKPLIAAVLALSLALSGCSGGGGEGGAGGSGGSEEAQQTSADTGETTAAPEETTAEATSAASSEETTEQGSSGASTALSGGLGEARSAAESWNEDAELYAIASLQPTVNAEGENDGWLYSFVSESTGSIISVPYSGGEVQNTQGQELPEGQIERISRITLSTDDLVDTPEAIQRSEEVRSYLEENPQAGASAGVDAASRDEPEWILSVPAKGLQDRVPAVE